jgi:hypothetical protein
LIEILNIPFILITEDSRSIEARRSSVAVAFFDLLGLCEQPSSVYSRQRRWRLLSAAPNEEKGCQLELSSCEGHCPQGNAPFS